MAQEPTNEMKRMLSGAALAAFLTLSTAANAQGVDEFGAYGGREEHYHGSPQNAAFELRIGPYRPGVDQGVSGQPFEDTFGNDTRILLGMEVDWQALRIPHFGSFGPGFGWGYTKFSADALLGDGSGERSAQSTSLEIMPMYVVGVLRVDVLARDTIVPLVPYAKVGLGYALWWVGDGDGTARAEDGTVGRGSSYGYHYALGLMLLLDIVDRAAAAQMDYASGINNSYLFFEWYGSQLDGFGSGDQMQVGTNTWTLGLAFEI
jgi:hypothetical protein